MLCPSCRTELIVTGQARLETLDEHVTNPNGIPSLKDKYICPNEDCAIAHNSFWDEWGGHYCEDFRESSELQKAGHFIDNNTGPFGSWERKSNVEIYKKDENYDFGRIGRFRFHKCYSYEADEDGNILKRRWRVQIWKRDNRLGMDTLHIPGIKMLFFSIGQFHRERKWKDTPGILDSNTSFRRRGEWWRRLAYWYAVAVTKVSPVKGA